MDEDLARKVDRTLGSKSWYLEAARYYLDTLRPCVAAITEEVPMSEAKPSRRLVVRCIAKRTQENFDAIIEMTEGSHSFVGPLILRPLCEDLIYGSWLATLPKVEANKVVNCTMQEDMLRSLRAQTRFLPKIYSSLTFWSESDRGQRAEEWWGRTEEFIDDQVSIIDKVRSEVRANLKELGLQLGWPGGRIPSIRYMAEQCSLDSYYEFFYHGASKAVHSDVHRMTQMMEDLSHESFSISNKGMAVNHKLFAVAYGLLLTEEIFDRVVTSEFSVESSTIDNEARSVWQAMLLVGLARNDRLPPLVTPSEEFFFVRSLSGKIGNSQPGHQSQENDVN